MWFKPYVVKSKSGDGDEMVPGIGEEGIDAGEIDN
jgi:hypothetical protein